MLYHKTNALEKENKIDPIANLIDLDIVCSAGSEDEVVKPLGTL